MTTRTCKASLKTTVHHTLSVPQCCPVSGNPQNGSTIRVSYIPKGGVVVPVEALAEMLDEYIGGLGEIRAQEEMIQDFATRCAGIISSRVRVRADLLIAPPYGGEVQRMTISVRG